MENISQKDINRAVQLLKDNLMFEVADAIEKADIIPKLYVYTYFKKVKQELGTNIERDELQTLVDHNSKLGLFFLTDKTLSSVTKIIRLLDNGFEREGKFCDFNDSKFQDKIQIGECQCEEHNENVGSIIKLTEDEQKIFDKINETQGWFEACKKFKDKFNPDNQELKPVYFVDEDSAKFEDNPDWWCETCRDSTEACEIGVSCDME
jgi:predicted RNA-binding protein (virulence factor B family)